MDLNEIKKIIEQDNAKIIIVENGEPVIVVSSFADYQKYRGGSGPKPEPKEKEFKTPPAPSADRVEDEQSLPPELTDEELKIEDLPF